MVLVYNSFWNSLHWPSGHKTSLNFSAILVGIFPSKCVKLHADERLETPNYLYTDLFSCHLQAFLKHQMVEPVLSVLFPIMCAGSEEDEDEDDLDDHECRMPSMYAPQVSSPIIQCVKCQISFYQNLCKGISLHVHFFGLWHVLVIKTPLLPQVLIYIPFYGLNSFKNYCLSGI